MLMNEARLFSHLVIVYPEIIITIINNNINNNVLLMH